MTTTLNVIARLFGCCVRRVHIGKLAISGNGKNKCISTKSNEQSEQKSVAQSSPSALAPNTSVRGEEALKLSEDKSILEDFANEVRG